MVTENNSVESKKTIKVKATKASNPVVKTLEKTDIKSESSKTKIKSQTLKSSSTQAIVAVEKSEYSGAVTLNNLQNALGSKHNSKRLGRGIGSGKGKTAGKGHKGQKARKGISIRWFEGGQTSLIKRLPKRGFKPLNKEQISVVNFLDITRLYEANRLKDTQEINKELLHSLGLIKSINEKTKLLSKGEFTIKKAQFHLDYYSKSAKDKVESLGGKCI
jgi:large subunit ribosomal protein L15